MYERIVVALDGSKYSLIGGDIALALAKKYESSIFAVHIYDGQIHSHRLREMEPVLPEQYQEKQTLERVRQSHYELIYDGFKALSKGYIEEFEKKALNKGLAIEQVYREGRNYLEIARIVEDYEADLMVMGAYGLGYTENGFLGSTAQRVLRFVECDTLIARRRLSQGHIMVGIDGSKDAFKALEKASEWSRCFKKHLHLVASYDPFFHSYIFKAMAGALSHKRQEEVGISKQKNLHDSIVDKGLGKLYQGFLDEAKQQVNENSIDTGTNLLKGKAYRTIVEYSEENNIDIIIVGRYGHHRSDLVRIGSNSETVTRIAHTNVLITRSV
jgi:nucleotide-binding universal stress UspA family protein